MGHQRGHRLAKRSSGLATLSPMTIGGMLVLREVTAGMTVSQPITEALAN